MTPEPKWITSRRPWGERRPVADRELGDWIWAGAAAAATFTLSTTFLIPDDQAVVDATVLGAVRDAGNTVLLAINNVTGFAGGEIQTFGAEYPVFEGEISTWIHAGENRLSIRITAAPNTVPGVSTRVRLIFANGSQQEIVTDATWQAETGEAAVVVPPDAGDHTTRRRLFPEPWPAPLLRRVFTVPKKVRAAHLTICGLGCFEAWLNGTRVGDHVLDPAQTNYEHHAFSVRHNVTDLLHAGETAVGLMLGHGWYAQNLAWTPFPTAYGKPAVWATLTIEHDDGAQTTLITDTDWKTMDGPIRLDNLYRGEVYDADYEQPGWSQPDFNDDNWQTVETVAPRTPEIVPQTIPPMRRIRTLTVAHITEPKPGLFVFDFGENIPGWARLSRKHSPANHTVRLRFGEALRPDGTVDFRSTGPGATRQVQRDEYRSGANQHEDWEPRFTYHGFQYVEVSGLPAPLDKSALTAVVVHTDLGSAGTFQSDSTMLDQMETLARRSLLSNLHGIITDCPHRERCQWHADAEVVTDYALYALDAASLFSKALDDLVSNLTPDGLPKEIGVGKRSWPLHDFGWGTFLIQVPWRLYLYQGDLAVVNRHYDHARRFLESYLERYPDGIIPEALYGDHAPPPTDHAGNPIAACPRDGYATMLFFEATQTLANLAEKTGRTADAERYQRAAEKIRAALQRRFYDPVVGGYAHPTLDAYALLLGVHSRQSQARLISHFRHQILEKSWMNTGGFFGYRRIAEAAVLFLPEPEALAVLCQDHQPGLPYWITRGATSVWEQFFRADEPERYERSWNHFAYGSVCEILWRHVAGIAPDSQTPGFRKIHFGPRLTTVLGRAEATHASPLGTIRAAWRRTTSGDFLYDITIPNDAIGSVRVPLAQPTNPIRVNDAAAQIESRTDQVATLRDLAAGRYTIRVSAG